MVVVFMLLVAGAFIGGALGVCRAGEKEGICQYGNENREEGKN